MDILQVINFIFQPTFCDFQNIGSKTIGILHDSHFLMLKIYEVLILNLRQNCRTKISLYSHHNYRCLCE